MPSTLKIYQFFKFGIYTVYTSWQHWAGQFSRGKK